MTSKVFYIICTLLVVLIAILLYDYERFIKKQPIVDEKGQAEASSGNTIDNKLKTISIKNKDAVFDEKDESKSDTLPRNNENKKKDGLNLDAAKTKINEFETNSNETLQTVNQTKEENVTLPEGHMKKLGEHDKPIIGEIKELDYMIGGKDFYESFLRKRKPVLFKGITSNWVATKKWKNESYLKEEYHDVIFDVEMGKLYKKLLNTRKTMDFVEFLSSYKNTSMYLDSPFPQSRMMKDLEIPLMLQCEKLSQSFTSMHLLFSNGDTSSPLHLDGYENLLVVLSGQKFVYAIAPKYMDNLYMNIVEDFPGLSPINPEEVDFVKYPKFHGTPFHKIVINAGDVLFIPRGWFHQVRSFQSPNIAASMWFDYFPVGEKGFDYRNSTAQEETFSKLVDEAPESIECLNQNVPLRSFDQITLNVPISNEVKDKRKYGPPVDPDLVNNTVLFEEVRLDEATIFVGSDDRWIYAIELLTGKIKWKVETKQDTGSTCAFNLDGKMVYCGADDSYVRAMHVNNGSLVWAFKTNGAVVSSACVDSNGHIYIGSLDKYFYAIFPNGTRNWRKKLKGAIWSSPVQHRHRDIIYIATNNELISNIFALKKSDGKIIWRYRAIGSFISSPKLNHLSTLVYLCDTLANVYVFNSLDGQLEFVENLASDSIHATPAISMDGVMYVTLVSGTLLALDTVETKKIVWEIQLGNSSRGSNSSPHIGWDGILYVGGGNGSFYAINQFDGLVLWKTDIGTGIFFSSPRLSKNGLVFIGSVDGPLYALDSKAGSKVWSTLTDGPLVGTALITAGYI